MPITSTKIRFRKLAALLLISSTASATDSRFTAITEGTRYFFGSKNNQSVAIDRKTQHIVALSATLKDIVQSAEDIYWIQEINRRDQEPLFLIIAHTLSRPLALGRGYCGGGYEDSLLLIQKRKNNVEIIDTYTLQSCLKAISAYSETGSLDISRILVLNIDGSHSITAIEQGKYTTSTIKVEDGKFNIAKSRAND